MKAIKLNRGKIKVYGKSSKLAIKGISREDKAFLHNLFTNDINNLKPFHFNYNLRLKSNGNPIDEFFVYNLEDYFLLDTNENSKKIIEEFTKLKLSLQVYFEDLTQNFIHIYVFGEKSDEFIKDMFNINLQPFEFKYVNDTLVARNFLRCGENGYDIITRQKELLGDLEFITEDEFEYIRIKNCIPKIGKELKEGYLPLETPIAKFAINFNKGCYVGQEVIARVYFRGATPRTLVKFKNIDTLNEGEIILSEGKKVGEITSVNKDLSLGYMLRNSIKNNEIFTTEKGNKLQLLGECSINEKNS
jgi:folate-binding protein YgfZ